ncbi:MAG: hypothetical protein NTX88_07885 [Candidatus Atribacteria bacterium]|nr:hypothetical protein [Candidatus Atribacteria bacterium]
MQKIFSMYRLRPGVTVEEFRKWSVSMDQKVTPFQPGVYRFEVYEIEGTDQGEITYQIVEDIDAESWEAWQKVLKSESQQEVVKTWEELCDPSSLKVFYGRKIK